MSAVVSKKKRERQSANQALARHSGEGRNPVMMRPVQSDKVGENVGEQKWSIGSLLKPRSEKASPVQFPNLPYVGLEHVESHTTKLLGTVPAGEMRSTAKRFYAGDVLYSRLRPYLNKVWRADRDGLCSAEFIVLPGNDKVDANFLRYRLNAADFVAFANSLNAGDRPRVDFGQIGCFELPKFDLATQRTAVAEIEKQFTRLDAGVAALRRVQANLKRYRAGVLKAACEGHLVPTEAELAKAEGRTYETGEQLLARILTDRRKNWHGRGKYKEPAAPDTTNLPPLPEGWAWARLEQLGVTYGGLTKNPKRAKLPRQLPYLRVANVYANELRLDDIEYIGVADSELEKLLVRVGDLLIVEGNGSKDQIGRLAIWDGSIDPCVHQNHLIKVRLANPAMSKWILYWLQSTGGRHFVELVASSTSGLYTLSVNKVGDLPILLPPVAELARIVAEVERCLSVIEELDAAVTANLQRAARLRQSVLQCAFTCQ